MPVAVLQGQSWASSASSTSRRCKTPGWLSLPAVARSCPETTSARGSGRFPPVPCNSRLRDSEPTGLRQARAHPQRRRAQRPALHPQVPYQEGLPHHPQQVHARGEAVLQLPRRYALSAVFDRHPRKRQALRPRPQAPRPAATPRARCQSVPAARRCCRPEYRLSAATRRRPGSGHHRPDSASSLTYRRQWEKLPACGLAATAGAGFLHRRPCPKSFIVAQTFTRLRDTRQGPARLCPVRTIVVRESGSPGQGALACSVGFWRRHHARL